MILLPTTVTFSALTLFELPTAILFAPLTSEREPIPIVLFALEPTPVPNAIEFSPVACVAFFTVSLPSYVVV